MPDKQLTTALYRRSFIVTHAHTDDFHHLHLFLYACYLLGFLYVLYVATFHLPSILNAFLFQ